VGHYLKIVSAPEPNYEIYDKEMLAIIRALEEWRAELEGLQRGERLDIYTDHRALEIFYIEVFECLTWRTAFLSRFHFFLIRYRPGKENTLIDALPWRETSDGIFSKKNQILKSC
jgi:reverse transcriptase-like protein